MAFNLVGTHPNSAVGKELMLSMLIWHPLWEYVEDKYPDIASKMPNAHFNSGESLDDKSCVALANLIELDIITGVVEEYVNNFKDFINKLPDTDCYRCFGIGKHRTSILKALSGPCEACNGTGRSKQFVARYTLELQDFTIFVLFLKSCGGFVIR